jgi:gamma-glutamyltranspeptidase/glutathione hydrolase
MTSPRTASHVTGRRGAAATGHPLATAAAVAMLERGGTAADAAVAAHAVLAVVLPEACGVGGDALFLVRTPRGVVAYNGTGSTGTGTAPGAGSTDGLRAGIAATPGATSAGVATDGGASVTVPGSVDAWALVRDAHGRLPLPEVLAPAVAIAEGGFEVGPELHAAVAAQRPRLLRGGAADWSLLGASPGDTVRQPELGQVLRAVGERGPGAVATGAVAEAVCRAVARDGGHLTPEDLQRHRTVVAAPLSARWGPGTVRVQPPSSQGVLLAMALQWLDREAGDLRAAPADVLEHVGVELTEAVFTYRDRCAADGERLLDLPLAVDRERATRRGGPRAYLHTTGVAVADATGTVVSSLLSLFDDFGSATFVPEGGFVLNNRAAGFTRPPNDPGPGRRPVHTLAPALVEGPDGVTALATPGADGQVQTLLQVLARVRFRGQGLPDAVGAPRWRSVEGALVVGAGHDAARALRARGHDVQEVDDGDARFGAVVSASWTGGTTSATGDWRRQVSTGGA